jgi:hypothetical protein
LTEKTLTSGPPTPSTSASRRDRHDRHDTGVEQARPRPRAVSQKRFRTHFTGVAIAVFDTTGRRFPL